MGKRYAKSKKETDTGRKIGGKETNAVGKAIGNLRGWVDTLCKLCKFLKTKLRDIYRDTINI